MPSSGHSSHKERKERKERKEVITASVKFGEWLLIEAADNSSDWSWFLVWPFEIQEEISQLSGQPIITYQALHHRLGKKPSKDKVEEAARSKLLAPGLFDLDSTRKLVKPDFTLPLPPAKRLTLPSRVKAEWSEMEVSPEGLERYRKYYSPEGGWVSLEDEWLHLKGYFLGEEIAELLKRLESRIVEPTSLRLEDPEARKIRELKLKPKGFFLASGERIKLARN